MKPSPSASVGLSLLSVSHAGRSGPDEDAGRGPATARAAGARMVEVEYPEQMERAITGKTAMIYFLVADKHFGAYRDQLDAPGGKLGLDQFSEGRSM